MSKKKAESPPSDWMAWIEKRRVRLQPVVGPKGVDWWSAGFVSTTRAGQNITRTCASGSTPLAALQALCRGDYWMKDDVMVNLPEVQARQKKVHCRDE